MTLVELLDIEDLPPAAAEVARGGRAQYGQVLNTWASIFQRPEIFQAYLPFLRAVAGPGAVAQEVKDLSALLVGWLNGCRYTVSHRATAAMRNGVRSEDVVDVALERWDRFSPQLRAAFRFTRALTLEPPLHSYAEQRHGVPPAVRDDLAAHFTEPQIVELTMSVSVWNGLSRYHRVMGFDLDMPAPPEPLDSILLQQRREDRT